MQTGTCLIVAESPGTSSRLSDLLSTLGYTKHLECSHKRAMLWLNEGNLPLLCFLNIAQSDSASLKFLTYIREMNPATPVVVVGTTGEIRLIVEAVQLGATDYLIAPFDAHQVQLTIEQALDKVKLAKRDSPDFLLEGILTSPEMMRACDTAKMVARTDIPVLITGESGVGKEVFARFIHTNSSRAGKPFVKVNCAALPNELLESELFGHERGAFTGAATEKAGKFELAHGGTILLDEIGEMTPQLQAKLLHVLQDGEFSRLGGNRQLKVDARVIAATNCKLEAAVSNGQFRQDLYFRLNVIRLRIPPLRERKQEILSLSNYFVQKYRDKYGYYLEELPPEILHRFLDYDWPGNVRQLENVIRQYLVLRDVDVELADFSQKTVSSPAPSTTGLHDPILAHGRTPQRPVEVEFESLKQVGERAAERAEREVVLWMLDQTSWNRKLAARRLNICYKALLNKIKKWQIRRPPAPVTTPSRRRIITTVGSPESQSERVMVPSVDSTKDHEDALAGASGQFWNRRNGI